MKSPKRILICNSQPLDEISGINTYAQNLLAGFRKLNVEAEVFSIKKSGGGGYIGFAKNWNAVGRCGVVHLNTADIITALIALVRFRKIVLKIHYPFWGEVLVSPEFPRRTYFGAFFNEVRLRIRQYGLRRFGSLLRSNVHIFSKNFIMLVANRVIAVSRFTADSATLPRKCVVVRNPGPRAVDATWVPPLYKNRIVFGGRFGSEKGLDVLMAALKICAERKLSVVCEIIGDGPLRDQVHVMAAEVGSPVEIIFRGPQSNAFVLAALRDALAGVLCSNWNEPAGYTQLEAASVGRTVIAAKRGGIPEYVGDRGVLFGDDSPQQLADKIQWAMEHTNEMLELGKRAHEHVRAYYSPEAAAEAFLEAIS